MQGLFNPTFFAVFPYWTSIGLHTHQIRPSFTQKFMQSDNSNCSYRIWMNRNRIYANPWYKKRFHLHFFIFLLCSLKIFLYYSIIDDLISNWVRGFGRTQKTGHWSEVLNSELKQTEWNLIDNVIWRIFNTHSQAFLFDCCMFSSIHIRFTENWIIRSLRARVALFDFSIHFLW